MLDQADDVHIENLNEASLKRMVLQLERKIKANQEQRIKFCDEPEKFLKSEVDLDEEVKKFTLLAAHPALYKELLQLDGLPLIIGLLNHSNTDIAVDVFEVLSELTDPEAIAEIEGNEAFITALLDAQLCEMSAEVLLRITEDSEEEQQAVTNCLTMFENLTEANPEDICNKLGRAPKLIPWLIKRVRASGAMDYNRVYAAEILGIMLQNSLLCREAMVKHDGVDKLLRGIAVYRKKDPSDAQEVEYVENMFDCLCSLMLHPPHQVSFGKVQGLELMIRMMREHKFASSLALKLADHSLRHCEDNCQVFVEKLGLPVLFTLFMKRGPKAKTKAAAREQDEHAATILQSLCRYCTGTAVARVLNKFTETSFEKLERLLELHEESNAAVLQADKARLEGNTRQIDRELEVDEDEQLFLDRCDAGLFTLQQVDIALLRLASMGNRQMADEIGRLIDIKGVPLKEVADTVLEYCSNLGEAASAESVELRSFLRAMLKRFGADVPAELEQEEAKDQNGKRDLSETPSPSPVREEKAADVKRKDKKDKKEHRAETPSPSPAREDGVANAKKKDKKDKRDRRDESPSRSPAREERALEAKKKDKRDKRDRRDESPSRSPRREERASEATPRKGERDKKDKKERKGREKERRDG